MVRRGRVLSHALLFAVAGAACVAGSDEAATADDAPPAVRAAMAARTVYPAKREEWRTDITRHTDSTMLPKVFRASHTTVALLQEYPTRISQFELHGKGMLLSTRPGRIDSVLNADVPRDLVAPVELSRVTDEGQVDVIDSASSVLMRESIGGFVFKRDLPLLRGGSHRLCTVSPATLLHVRHLGERHVLEAYTITAIAADDRLVGRHRLTNESSVRLRFGTGDARRCLLLGARDVYVVTAVEHEGTVANPRVTRLEMPGNAKPRSIAEPTAARGAVTIQQPFVVDAAVVDGGFVVLVGVSSDRAGRVIDYYDEQGAYLQSAMLPFTASAMTGAGPRFLALHRDERYRWWLSSWLTPMAARGAVPPAPPPLSSAPERQLFETPGAAAPRR
ncbi:hypothetical protein MASR1M101_12230 [Gemmatimonas sp.]